MAVGKKSKVKKTAKKQKVKKGGKLMDHNMKSLTKMAKKVGVSTSVKGQKRKKVNLVRAIAKKL